MSHLTNLNYDSLLCGMINYALKLGENVIGKKVSKNSNQNVDFCLGGIGIGPQHCKVKFE